MASFALAVVQAMMYSTAKFGDVGSLGVECRRCCGERLVLREGLSIGRNKPNRVTVHGPTLTHTIPQHYSAPSLLLLLWRFCIRRVEDHTWQRIR